MSCRPVFYFKHIIQESGFSLLLQEKEPHGVTTQKTPFFIVTAVKTSNLTEAYSVWPNRWS
jgi:hypothetical protein